eukprot:CAMPEP_0198265728 /NCGR_PEP_ID=MMETSP1447-20131203/24267_1 /TAXON_ID=420782 /ORGANISM="Chaetoceros dichaeta, Strain CCMP1751" /LENGTH=662 /DNA_ID=CAMNT_0043955387 /DNA_START=329 /DNA_END=2317 /DNA_ORIENTATION=+
MSFHDIDNAKRLAASTVNTKRSKKRKEPGNVDNGSLDRGESDCRTGRWTTEEMSFCDRLILLFTAGDLPISDGTKLNDFLANMLKSKQSRLTKKMKNANLSGKSFSKRFGYIPDAQQCKQFSELEEAFYRSISSPMERADVRFHMQKEWRENFSNYSLSVGQPLDADAWLSTVEEKEKRDSMVKDAARMARRKMMMGVALDRDTKNPEHGVFIDREEACAATGIYRATLQADVEQDDTFNLSHDVSSFNSNVKCKGGTKNSNKQRHWHYASPFLGQIISFIQRHGYPFEHVDAWVPSFVPDSEASEGSGSGSNPTCRLCFAGSATAEVQIPTDGIAAAQLLTREEQFNLLSFGEYSQKFSFNVGCGLPGRVYESGIPAWEQSVDNAPHNHFERCGGAIQCSVKTVVGIPVPSPNVGRIVVVVYSHHDRCKDQEMVGRLYEEFKKLVPSPKWKLVVDIGTKTQTEEEIVITPATGGGANLSPQTKNMAEESQLEKLVALLGEHMPHDLSSPHIAHLSGFMSCRLMLLKPVRTPQEEETASTLLSSYISYLNSGRANSDIAMMIARDFMFLKQQLQPQTHLTNHVSSIPTAHPLNPNAVGSYMSSALGQNQMLSNQGPPPPPPQLTPFDTNTAFLSQQNLSKPPITLVGDGSLSSGHMKPARHP